MEGANRRRNETLDQMELNSSYDAQDNHCPAFQNWRYAQFHSQVGNLHVVRSRF